MERKNLALLCAGVVCFWLFALAFGTAQGNGLRQQNPAVQAAADQTQPALRPSLFTCGKAPLSALTKLSLVALTPDHHGVPCLCTELISSLCVFRPVKAASASGRSE